MCGNVQTANATVYIIDHRPAAGLLIRSELDDPRGRHHGPEGQPVRVSWA